METCARCAEYAADIKYCREKLSKLEERTEGTKDDMEEVETWQDKTDKRLEKINERGERMATVLGKLASNLELHLKNYKSLEDEFIRFDWFRRIANRCHYSPTFWIVAITFIFMFFMHFVPAMWQQALWRWIGVIP